MKRLLATIISASLLITALPINALAMEETSGELVSEEVKEEEINFPEIESEIESDEESAEEESVEPETVEYESAEPEESNQETELDTLVEEISETEKVEELENYDEEELELNGASEVIDGTITLLDKYKAVSSTVGGASVVQCIRFTPTKDLSENTVKGKLTITQSKENVGEKEFSLEKEAGTNYYEGYVGGFFEEMHSTTDTILRFEIGEACLEKNVKTTAIKFHMENTYVGYGCSEGTLVVDEYGIDEVSKLFITLNLYDSNGRSIDTKGNYLKNGSYKWTFKSLTESTNYSMLVTFWYQHTYKYYKFKTTADKRKIICHKVSAGASMVCFEISTANLDVATFKRDNIGIYIRKKGEETYRLSTYSSLCNKSNIKIYVRKLYDDVLLENNTEYDYVITTVAESTLTDASSFPFNVCGSFTTHSTGEYVLENMYSKDINGSLKCKIQDSNKIDIETGNCVNLVLKNKDFGFFYEVNKSDLTVTSSDSSIVSVSGYSVKALKKGKAILTITANNVPLWMTGVSQKNIEVEVKDAAPEIKLDENILLNNKTCLKEVELPDGYEWKNPKSKLDVSTQDDPDVSVYYVKYCGDKYFAEETKAYVKTGKITGLTLDEKITDLDHKKKVRIKNDNIVIKPTVLTKGIVEDTSYDIKIASVKGLNITQNKDEFIIKPEKTGNYTVVATLNLKDSNKALFSARYTFKAVDEEMPSEITTVRLDKTSINMNTAYDYEQIYKGLNEKQLINAKIPEGKSIESIDVENSQFEAQVFNENQILIIPASYNIKAGTYSTKLKVKVSGKEELFPVKIKVYCKLPTGVTVKQDKVVNLAYISDTVTFLAKVNGSGINVEGMYWDNQEGSYNFNEYNRMGTTPAGFKCYQIKYGSEANVLESGKKQMRAGFANGKLRVYVRGYSLPVEKKMKIKAVYKTPSISAADGVTNLCTAIGEREATISLKDGETNKDIALTEDKDYTITAEDFETKVNSDGTVYFKYTGKKKTAYLTIKCKDSNWREYATYKHKVTVIDPKVELERKQYDHLLIEGYNYDSYASYIRVNGNRIKNVSFEAAPNDAKSKSLIEKDIIEVSDSGYGYYKVYFISEKYLWYYKKIDSNISLRVKASIYDENTKEVLLEKYLTLQIRLRTQLKATAGATVITDNNMAVGTTAKSSPELIFTQSLNNYYSYGQSFYLGEVEGDYSQYFKVSDVIIRNCNINIGQYELMVVLSMTEQGRKILKPGQTIKLKFKYYQEMNENPVCIEKVVTFKILD